MTVISFVIYNLFVHFFPIEVDGEISRVCGAQAKSIDQPHLDPSSQDSLLHRSEKCNIEDVKVKQEKPEETECLDSLKGEGCLLAVQSLILEEWKQEMFDNPRQKSKSPPSHIGLQQGKKSSLSGEEQCNCKDLVHLKFEITREKYNKISK